ncbi:type I-C CRISPR-associated protein Cas7/Csd2 [Phytomonospora sp. NPDC050363]|uniref:type I-C CRISPR-associated protein Cas7/Csd2 n=1 Tax=Phytomonospora sp. NPDC050363 TaxID=3155642 RepID=UPI0033DCE8C7
MTNAHLDPAIRHDVVIYFDVTDGNPNGDPDGANQPRIDDTTGEGLVTDVAIKRKIRNTVSLLKGDDPRYGIFVEAGHALNTRIDKALKESAGDPADARTWLCDHYFDIRTFGAVLSTGAKVEGKKGRGAGQIYGPVQLTFARSVDPIDPTTHAITRVTQTKQEDIDKGESTEMGSKWTVPYGLYRAHLFYSAPRAAQTGITGDDLAVLWQSIEMMFEHDRSATRGEMKLCGLYVFNHPNSLGAASAHSLTSRIDVKATNPDKPARRHTDYTRTIATDDLPTGITCTTLVDLWP